MLEANGDLWVLPADARCITTNGYVKADGAAVMGRGCALEARERFPGVDMLLGHRITKAGNHVHILPVDTRARWELVSFPVKHHWREKADLDLIARSCAELTELIEGEGWERVLLPRPGCGNGQLSWEGEVRPLISYLLDDRVVVIDR
jgi:hypothetical protein